MSLFSVISCPRFPKSFPCPDLFESFRVLASSSQICALAFPRHFVSWLQVISCPRFSESFRVLPFSSRFVSSLSKPCSCPRFSKRLFDTFSKDETNERRCSRAQIRVTKQTPPPLSESRDKSYTTRCVDEAVRPGTT